MEAQREFMGQAACGSLHRLLCMNNILINTVPVP